MLYALICTDKPHSVELRLTTRDEHRAYLASLGDKLKMGGPFSDDDGNMNGSLLVIEASNRDEALAVSQEDPYSRVGLFETVEIRPFNWTAKNPNAD